IAVDLDQQTGTSENRSGGWHLSASPAEAVSGADAALVLTEWQAYASLEWKVLAASMRQPAWLFDARGICDAAAARSAGLQVWRLGLG
ncbi:UDP binding domain-containing protein, partial [Synechococcus sp. Cruz CV12-2-Slac-r]|uniref:UDP binding domain-containing protein n=1 Tax=Synechococcus sp. Cruz CV12-2-Slac-r TaxID=2823748 RepID=UPI0020CBA6F8